MRAAIERVRAVGHVVTFEGEMAIRVERIVGASPRTGVERTRKIWERGRAPGTAAANAIRQANAVRDGEPPRPRLSRAQRAHLAMLLAAGAASRHNAVSIFDHPAVRDLVPSVVARLGELGLTDRRVAHRVAAGSRLTVYWLTQAGALEAVRLSAEGAA